MAPTLSTRRFLPLNRRSGFTIVEILVVVGIIAVLLSLVSIGLRRGGETARQTSALNALREISRAWAIYGNQNDDRCLPGYLDEGAQQNFRIRTYNQSGELIDRSLCQTYPFRLLPFLDFDRSLLYRYILDYEDSSLIPDNVIRDNPAFGYNAYYVGGWYTTDPGTNVTQMTFAGAGYFSSPGNLVPNQEVVARSVAQIEQPSELITFSSSAAATPGFYKNADEVALGSAWVVPQRLGQEQIWTAADGPAISLTRGGDIGNDGVFASLRGSLDTLLTSTFGSDANAAATESRFTSQAIRVQQGSGIEVLVPQSVPLRRIRNTVQTVRADGSTAVQSMSDLMNMRKWVNPASRAANPVEFSHP
jgi:prepilin-type N-terminal cleavage/methylation domain-containing protein